MTTQKHIIRKQTFEFTLFDPEDAKDFQQKISDLYHTRILPKLDEQFSRFIDPATVLQIERLEIDLGTICLANLEEEISEKILQCFQEELSHKIVHLQFESRAEKRKPQTGSKIPDPYTPFRSPPEDRIVSKKVSELELLEYFLRTGTLPWWASNQFTDSFVAIFAGLLENAPEQMRLLIANFLHDTDSRYRLIFQFSDPSLLDLVELLLPGERGDTQDLVHDLFEIYRGTAIVPKAESQFRLLIWDAIFTVILLSPQREVAGRKALRYILESLARGDRLSYQRHILWLHKAARELLHSQFPFRSRIPEWVAILKNELSPTATLNESAVDTKTPFEDLKEEDFIHPEWTFPVTQEILHEEGIEVTGRSHEIQEGIHRFQISDTPVQTAHDDQKALPASGLIEKEKIYINNAGLVLLWPYLHTFFQHTGLFKKDKFVSKTSAMRAIHLLQYLVTGADDTPEYLLALNKLICGWDIHKPISRHCKISVSEKTESETLLMTVISHWAALKNTSIKGFQTSFLQREGVLLEKEHSWLLQVERKAYDMLLERLPWSISIIKLSWMKTIIYIEW